MTSELALSGRSTVVAAGDQTSCRLADEVVVLSLKAGVYYGLNPVAARVWDLVREPRTVDEVLAVLVEEYDVDPAPCKVDLLALLKRLADLGLITVADGAPS